MTLYPIDEWIAALEPELGFTPSLTTEHGEQQLSADGVQHSLGLQETSDPRTLQPYFLKDVVLRAHATIKAQHQDDWLDRTLQAP